MPANFSAEDQKIIDQFKVNLVAGKVFATSAAACNANRFYGSYYKPPLNRETWAHAVEAFAQMAKESNALAQVATKLIQGLNLYGTEYDLIAKVYSNAADAIAESYTDVLALASPEPPRRSHAVRGYTLAECVEVAYWLEEAIGGLAGGGVKGVGWVLSAIREQENIQIWHRFSFEKEVVK